MSTSFLVQMIAADTSNKTNSCTQGTISIMEIEKNVLSDEESVLKTVKTFLGGIQARSKSDMLNSILPTGSACLLRDNKPITITLPAVIDRTPFDTTQVLDETMHDPHVLIDQNIAMVWAPYKFFVDGKLDHVGTNIFTMLKQEGKWVISGVADNSSDAGLIARDSSSSRNQE